MDRFTNAKAEFPAVYVGDGLVAPHKCNARRVSSAIVKAVLAVVCMGFALALIYQVIHGEWLRAISPGGLMWLANSFADKQSYESLLSKYNGLVAEKESLPTPPVVTLAHRALESNSATYTYTTTTVTQGTTITIKTTASSSSLPASASVSSEQTATTASSGQCSAGTPQTVTVTVTSSAALSTSASAVSDMSTYVTQSISTNPITVLETRVTTATIFVTASGLVSPKAETLTITATATDMRTSTEFATVNTDGANKTSTGTSTSTAEAVFGASAPPSTHGRYTHYANTTAILSPYKTTGFGEAITSTASFTLTVPPGVGHTGTVGGTGKLTTPLGTTTTQVDPVSTVVTVSGAYKTAGVSAGVVLAAAFVAVFHFF